jgi:hypothetical protein
MPRFADSGALVDDAQLVPAPALTCAPTLAAGEQLLKSKRTMVEVIARRAARAWSSATRPSVLAEVLDRHHEAQRGARTS